MRDLLAKPQMCKLLALLYRLYPRDFKMKKNVITSAILLAIPALAAAEEKKFNLNPFMFIQLTPPQ